jgi:hypothetical protein
MMALITNALPVCRWQSRQWQQFTNIGADCSVNVISAHEHLPSKLVIETMSAMRATGLLALLGACSFVGVRGPSDRVGIVPDDPAKVKCTDSTLFPSIDALGGAAAAAVAVGGIVLEKSSDDGKPEHFTSYYAGPLAVLSIVYFYAASWGNNRITWCTDAKERAEANRQARLPSGDQR